MSQNNSDTAYIHADPDCIGPHAIKSRREIFAYIDKIAEEMGTIAKTVSIGAGQNPRKLRAGEWYQNVISIFGERGSGKTILLLSACACLSKDAESPMPSGYKAKKDRNENIPQKIPGDILLPVIQPEYFGPEDTLLTWILSYLKEYVDAEAKSSENRFRRMKIKRNDDDDNDDDSSPADFIDQMRKDEALFSRKFSSHLAAQDITAEDFQRETLAVVESHVNFLHDWRKLVHGLIVKDEISRVSTDRKKRPFLIIPIDDADLNPAALPVILQQMQILQHPNVLFLFSAHSKSLRSMMYLSQMELNTNRANTRPVVNFTNLISHKLRDVEDVRVDAGEKIEKFLPRKYRVEIKPLPPQERLNFTPLIKTGQKGQEENEEQEKQKDKSDPYPTFLQLLQKIRLDIFGNQRLEDISQFFDLAQSFTRCPLEPAKCSKPCSFGQTNEVNGCKSNDYGTDSAQSEDIKAKSFCQICKLHQTVLDKKCKHHCRSPKYTAYEKAKTENNLQEIERLTEEIRYLVPPIPSVYAEALPKYPRAMEQVYQILNRWGLIIEKTQDISTKQKHVSHAVKELLVACLEYVPQLPREFRHRIKFIDNPNRASKHPILIDFVIEGLTNIVETGGGNEDMKPNWIFALMFRELEERLKKIKTLNSGIPIPRMRYNCHAGEHFASSIQGLRRIWEPVHYFPHLEGLGHGFALGISDRFPTEMPADELLDDLVWVLLQREHIQDVPLAIIERNVEKIAIKIYGTEFDKKDKPIGEILFSDLKDAYRWRFRREKIAQYVGVLSYDRKSRKYCYKPDFKLPEDENGEPLPKAAKILQRYFTRKEVAQPYKLSEELRDVLKKCYPFLRKFVKQQIIKKNVVVEVCPASNFRIGNLTKIEDHPLFEMCPADQKGGISVVFGSDDPAMFQTSIDDEYLFVKEAMDKKYPDLPQEKRLEYLETIRRRSMDLCCDDLPDEPVAILELIKKVLPDTSE